MRSKKAIKNILASLILQFVTIICGFIVPKLIISSFGSNVNGLVTSITQFLAYITLLESGIGPVIKSKLYKPIAKKEQKEIINILYSGERFFRTLAKIFIIYIVILCFIYPIIVAKDFEFIFTITLIIIISFSTLAEYYFGMTYKLYLQAEQKTYITSYFQIISTILNAIITVVLIKLGANILLVKLLSSIIFVIRPLLQNWYVKKKYNISLKEADKNYKLDQKWDGLAQHVAAVIHNNTDVVILTIFSSVSEVSVYSVYLLVITGVKRLIQSFAGGIDASFGDMIAKNEITTLNKSFSVYEFFYYTLTTIFFTCTFLLIIPFIKIYTYGINDVNYVRPLFAFLIILAEFINIIRLPYSTLTLAAGHFHETMKGAWLEAFLNVSISIACVFKFGIVGVALGTLISMIVRTIEFICHASARILHRKIKQSFKKIIIVLLETLLIVVILKCIPIMSIEGYLSWITYAIIVFTIASIVTVGSNLLIYKEERADLYTLMSRIIKKNKKQGVI